MKIVNKINLSFSAVLAIIIGVSLFTFYMIAKNNLEKAVYEHLITAAQSRANHIETFLVELEEETIEIRGNAIMQGLSLHKREA